jgi:hypothetical protein
MIEVVATILGFYFIGDPFLIVESGLQFDGTSLAIVPYIGIIFWYGRATMG